MQSARLESRRIKLYHAHFDFYIFFYAPVLKKKRKEKNKKPILNT